MTHAGLPAETAVRCSELHFTKSATVMSWRIHFQSPSTPILRLEMCQAVVDPFPFMVAIEFLVAIQEGKWAFQDNVLGRQGAVQVIEYPLTSFQLSVIHVSGD